MTIKRRLYVSNILMILIPIALTIAIGVVMMFIIRSYFNTGKGERLNDENRFYVTATHLMLYKENWGNDPSLTQIINDVEAFLGNTQLTNEQFSIYENDKIIYDLGSLQTDDIMLDMILAQPGEHQYTMDSFMAYSFDAGKYKIIYSFGEPLSAYVQDYNHFKRKALNLTTLMFSAVVLIILMTNGVLTKMVVNSIMMPLNTLVYGVHQIRDGNLDYRIRYDNQDEFHEVCEDFNEMAGHLKDMVSRRQKDDDNRRELIAGISHDLRTPLTSLKGYVIGLETGIDSTPEIRGRYLTVLKNKTEEIEHLVNQLFLFSKLDIGEFPIYPDLINLQEELVNFVEQGKAEYQEKGLEVILQEIPENIYLSLDRVQFHHVLINIFENAVKYVDKDIKKITISCQVDQNQVKLRMKDNGPGVPRGALNQLFDVFYRVDKARNVTSNGSGIGLAISKKIVERMGGTITAENGIDEGLIMIVSFPMIKRENEHA